MRMIIRPINIRHEGYQVIRLDRLDKETYAPVASTDLQSMLWFIVTTPQSCRCVVSERGIHEPSRLGELRRENLLRLEESAEVFYEHRIVCAHCRTDVVEVFGDIPSVQSIYVGSRGKSLLQ